MDIIADPHSLWFMYHGFTSSWSYYCGSPCALQCRFLIHSWLCLCRHVG